jgi:hypothetical protein
MIYYQTVHADVERILDIATGTFMTTSKAAPNRWKKLFAGNC